MKRPMNCALNLPQHKDLQYQRTQHYARLMSGAKEHPNSEPLAELIASWQYGFGVLPQWLGLSPTEFDDLHTHYFSPASPLQAKQTEQSSRLDARLDDLREDLLKLLRAYARDDHVATDWIAQILATACQGSDHLWEDLGVWNRNSLSQLLSYNFPELAARNSRDMKWKKFLFKQLCETEGLYICRAPTCDECNDFSDCFGSEE